MIGKIGNVLFSIYSQAENVSDLRVSFVNLWGQVMTLRGQILVSRTGDDTLSHPFLPPSPSPCVHSKRLRVYVRNVPMYAGTTSTC